MRSLRNCAFFCVGSIAVASLFIPAQSQERRSMQAPSSLADEKDTRSGDLPGSAELSETITFRFEIRDLLTNHQFEGHRNTFHVEYEYVGGLAGAGYDVKGRKVSAATFPYFQLVRDDIVKFATEYADRSDFYEIYGTNVGRFVMSRYPQIRRLTLTIDVPRSKEVAVDRSETIVLTRQGGAANRATR